MPATFPTTPRAPLAVRFSALAVGFAATILATFAVATSMGWIGRVFPGFLLLDNRVVPSIGLAQWSGAAIPNLYQSEIVSADGKPATSASEVYERTSHLRPGAPVTYRLRHFGGTERDVTIPTERFTARDWTLLFGSYLVNGIACLVCGLVVFVIGPSSPLSRALLALCLACAFFLFSAIDLYGPARFTRLHVAAETCIAAAGLQFTLLFPSAHRWARWRFVGYPLSLALLIPYEWFFYRPDLYPAFLITDMVYLGIVGAFFTLRLIVAYRGGASALVRQRVRIITLGSLFGLTLPAAIVGLSAFFGGGMAMNAAAATPFLFVLSLAYAVAKQDLFEIDAMVKRGAYYLLLTGAVGALYLGAVVLFNLVLRANAITDSAAFPVLFTFAVLLFFNPLRSRLQAFVDRVFFRTRYDAAQVLAAVGGDLAGALQRERIAQLVRDAVQAAIPNPITRVFAAAGDGTLTDTTDGIPLPDPLTSPLAAGRVVTAFDSAELYPTPAAHEAIRAALAACDAEVAVPLSLGGTLTGALTAGPKRSGLFYTAGDAEFLRALAHQAATAFANARSYEALVALNARLEDRVRERTAQLETANRELGEAYAELKSAEIQLVQSEKLASLGRLVAGVAHEINNPVSFIASNVNPLRRRLAKAAELAPADAQKLLREAEDIATIMGRGAERTAAIVKDLRTFSRLGEAVRKTVDVHESLDVTVRLLESRWRDRITIHRDYGDLPPIEGDPGQLNQVLMNVLANACDAIHDQGNLWLTTRVDGEVVTIVVRDDGCGMAPEVVERIFEPFFTTKDVGGGTGLGLAISHSVIAAHGGRIEVESAPGGGTTFRIVLPAAAAPARAAGA